MKKIILICLLMLSTVFAQSYSSSEAKLHIGENVTICGNVDKTYYARKSNGSPTFLSLGGAYPNQNFTVVIFGRDRNKFDTPEVDYDNENICVTGKIKEYKGKPQIVAKSKNQIKIQ